MGTYRSGKKKSKTEGKWREAKNGRIAGEKKNSESITEM